MANCNNHIDMMKMKDHYGRDGTTTVATVDILPQPKTQKKWG
jgi:hypothetical protein